MLGDGFLNFARRRRRGHDKGEVAECGGLQAEGLEAAAVGVAGDFLRHDGEEAGVNFTRDAERLEVGEVNEAEGGSPAVLDVAGDGGMAGLPTVGGRGDERGRLAAELDASEGGDGLGVVLGGVEVGGLARTPAALASFFGEDEGGGDALGELAVAFEEYAAGLEETRGSDAARLVEFKGFEQAAHERGTEVRLVLDERIGEGERLDVGGRGPSGDLLAGAQRVVDALIKTLANEGVGDLAIKEHDGVVVADEAGSGDDGDGNFFGAVEAHDFLDQVDGAIEVIAPTRDGKSPGGAAFLGGLLAGDDEFERFEGGAHLGGGDFEAELLIDVAGGNGDFAFPRNGGADAVDGAGDGTAGVGEDEINETVGGLVERVDIHAALVAVGGIGAEA